MKKDYKYYKSLIKVKERGYSLEFGFAHIVFMYDGEEYTIQACLDEFKKHKGTATRYKKAFSNNGGMDDGICEDVGSRAYEKLGFSFCFRFFKHEIRKENIRFK